MGYRHRYMYYMTGLPGWMRFGYSPGWIGRSPTGLPPTAQWLMQSGLLPQYMQWLQSQAPPMVPPAPQPQISPSGTAPMPFATPFPPTYTKEQEKQMLDQQVQMLESQLEAIRKRIEELGEQ
jgi:hypothetical protein